MYIYLLNGMIYVDKLDVRKYFIEKSMKLFTYLIY